MLLRIPSQKINSFLLLAVLVCEMRFSSMLASSSATATISKEEDRTTEVAAYQKAKSIRNTIDAISIKIAEDMKQILELKQQINGVFMLLGGVGSGKSTLINFVAKRTLQVVSKEFGVKHIVVEDPITHEAEVSSGWKGTRVPTPYFDKERGYIFYDCPGLEDLSGNDQLTNAFVFEKLFTGYSCYPIKIMFVFDVNTVSRVANFLPAIKNLARMFSEDIAKLKDSISAIATKHEVGVQDLANNPNVVLDGLKKDLASVISALDTSSIELSNGARQLLEGFESKSYPIAYFPKPTAVGEYLTKQLRNDLRKNIIDAAASAKHGLEVVIPRPIPSSEGVDSARMLLEELSEAIASFIKEQVKTEFVRACKVILTEEENVTKVRAKFEEFKEALLELRGDYKSFDEGYNALQAVMIKIISDDAVKKHFNGLLDIVKFLNSFGVTNVPFAQWYNSFEDVKGIASALAGLPEINEKNDVLEVSGIFFGTSDFIDKCDPKRHRLLVLHVGHTFYCDKDIDLPGVSCVVIAPLWIISDACSISLKGAKGVDGAKGKHHGTPGGAGSHGGHMFGKSLKAKGLENLTINTSGGKGGNGGSGKNGNPLKVDRESDGNFGPMENISAVRELNLRKIANLQRVSRYPALKAEYDKHPHLQDKFPRRITFKEGYKRREATPGKNGNSGGDAGRGGPGGIAGIISFDLLGEESKSSKNGDKGVDGKPGDGGEGSLGGTSRKITYFLELILQLRPCIDPAEILWTYEDHTFFSQQIEKSIEDTQTASGQKGKDGGFVEAGSNADSRPELLDQDLYLKLHEKWVQKMKKEKLAPLIHSMKDSNNDLEESVAQAPSSKAVKDHAAVTKHKKKKTKAK